MLSSFKSNAIQLASDRLPSKPFLISPEWLLYSHLSLSPVSTKKFPPYRQKKNQNNLNNQNNKNENKTRKTSNTPHIFEDMLFYVAQTTLDDENKEDNNIYGESNSSIEKSIVSNGGTLLSNKFLDSLKTSIINSETNTMESCCCFVIFFHSLEENYIQKFHLLKDLHNLYYSSSSFDRPQDQSSVNRNSSNSTTCEFIPINPNYIASCLIEKNADLNPTKFPLLFQPTTWPVLKYDHKNMKHDEEKKPMMVSITGFTGAQRYGIIQLLKQIGIPYTDSLHHRNSHLICIDPPPQGSAGAKFKYAKDYSTKQRPSTYIHIVTVKWLYHIMQHGYTTNCEEPFSLLKNHDTQKLTQDKNKENPIKSNEIRIVPCRKKEPKVNKDKKCTKPKNKNNLDEDYDKDETDAKLTKMLNELSSSTPINGNNNSSWSHLRKQNNSIYDLSTALTERRRNVRLLSSSNAHQNLAKNLFNSSTKNTSVPEEEHSALKSDVSRKRSLEKHDNSNNHPLEKRDIHDENVVSTKNENCSNDSQSSLAKKRRRGLEDNTNTTLETNDNNSVKDGDRVEEQAQEKDKNAENNGGSRECEDEVGEEKEEDHDKEDEDEETETYIGSLVESQAIVWMQ